MLPGLVRAVQGMPASQRNCSMKYAFTRLRAPSIFPRNQKLEREDFSMRRLSHLSAGLLIGAAALVSGAASGQSDGWITLLDSSKKGDWTEVGKANWEMKDGALVADKLDGKDPSYLVSKDSYKDFQIRAEFWTDEEANSGIFIRCDQRDKIDSKLCYEVNIFD